MPSVCCVLVDTHTRADDHLVRSTWCVWIGSRSASASWDVRYDTIVARLTTKLIVMVYTAVNRARTAPSFSSRGGATKSVCDGVWPATSLPHASMPHVFPHAQGTHACVMPMKSPSWGCAEGWAASKAAFLNTRKRTARWWSGCAQYMLIRLARMPAPLKREMWRGKCLGVSQPSQGSQFRCRSGSSLSSASVGAGL